MEKKAELGQAEELCAAHDLTPIFLRALGMNWDDIEEKLVLRRADERQSLRGKRTMDTLTRAFGKLTAKDHHKCSKK